MPKEGTSAHRAPSLLQIELPSEGCCCSHPCLTIVQNEPSRTMTCSSFMPLPPPGSETAFPHPVCGTGKERKKEGGTCALGTCSALHTPHCGITVSCCGQHPVSLAIPHKEPSVGTEESTQTNPSTFIPELPGQAHSHSPENQNLAGRPESGREGGLKEPHK